VTMRAQDGPRARPSAAARLIAVAITGYRRFISPVMLPHCRFQPSCSAYALEAVQRHGALRGSWLAVRRLSRCHPFHPGGVDPVPPAGGKQPSAARTAPLTSQGASR
jgi:uncharacterized protein